MKVIHVCIEDGDLPADFIAARNRGDLYVDSFAGMVQMDADDPTVGMTGNTYAYDLSQEAVLAIQAVQEAAESFEAANEYGVGGYTDGLCELLTDGGNSNV